MIVIKRRKFDCPDGLDDGEYNGAGIVEMPQLFAKEDVYFFRALLFDEEYIYMLENFCSSVTWRYFMDRHTKP